jgi:hypothetical protein
MMGWQLHCHLILSPLSLWVRVRVRAGFLGPLSLWERVRVRAGFLGPLSLWERVRVRAYWIRIRTKIIKN